MPQQKIPNKTPQLDILYIFLWTFYFIYIIFSLIEKKITQMILKINLKFIIFIFVKYLSYIFFIYGFIFICEKYGEFQEYCHMLEEHPEIYIH